MKTVLMYFLLIVLLFLLFLPPALRHFMHKEVDLDEVVEGKDVTTMITCTRNEETISFKYENKVIKELFYRVPGNRMHDENPDDLENEDNEIVKSIYSFSYNSYSEAEDITTFNLYFTEKEINEPLLENYTLSVSKEKKFIEDMKFSCEMLEIEN